jgi:hypothetical protein
MSMAPCDASSLDLPRYWSHLTSEDQHEYLQLKNEIEPLARRMSAECGSRQFQNVVERILRYTLRGDSSDGLRSFVCGLVWFGERDGNGTFAISTRHLCKLIGKCKSSINSGFQVLGYVAMPISPTHASCLAQIFPFMRSDRGAIRQWTIRGAQTGQSRVSFGATPSPAEALGETQSFSPEDELRIETVDASSWEEEPMELSFGQADPSGFDETFLF